MDLSTCNKDRKGDVFRAWTLFTYLLQNADSTPKVGCLPLGLDKAQKHAREEALRRNTLHMTRKHIPPGRSRQVHQLFFLVSWVTRVFWSMLPDMHTMGSCLIHFFEACTLILGFFIWKLVSLPENESLVKIKLEIITLAFVMARVI